MVTEKLEENMLEEDEDLIELIDDNGKHLKFFHVGSTEYKNKWYAFFMPAEEIEGLGEDEVVIFEVAQNEKGEESLLPVEDNALLEQVYEKFCAEMEEEANAAEAEELEGGCRCGGHHHGDECDCCSGDCDGDECDCCSGDCDDDDDCN